MLDMNIELRKTLEEKTTKKIKDMPRKLNLVSVCVCVVIRGHRAGQGRRCRREWTLDEVSCWCAHQFAVSKLLSWVPHSFHISIILRLAPGSLLLCNNVLTLVFHSIEISSNARKDVNNYSINNTARSRLEGQNSQEFNLTFWMNRNKKADLIITNTKKRERYYNNKIKKEQAQWNI